MAYIYNPDLNDEENKKKELEAQQSSGSAGVLSGNGEGGAGISSVQSGGVGDKGFTNLQRYITENKSQAQNLAGKVSSGLTAEANKVRGDIAGVGDAFNQRVGQNEIVKDDDLVNRAATDSTNFVKNQGDLASFIRQRDAQYGGPKTLEETELDDELGNQVGAAENKAKAIDTEEGRLGLVRDSMKTKGTGKVALNQALLQGDPNAAATLQGVKGSFSGLRDYLGQMSANAKTRAGEAQTKADEARANVQNKFYGDQGVIKQFEDPIKQRAAQKEQERQAYNSTDFGGLNTKLATNTSFKNITPEEAAFLKINPIVRDELKRSWMQVADNSPASYASQLTPYQTVATKENTSTADDFAKQAALQNLLSNYQGQLNSELAGEAGKFNLASPKFDNTKAVQDQIKRYDDLIKWWSNATGPGSGSAAGNIAAFTGKKNLLQQWLEQNSGNINYETAPYNRPPVVGI